MSAIPDGGRIGLCKGPPEGFRGLLQHLVHALQDCLQGRCCLCGTSIDVRRLAESELIEDTKRSNMAQLADCMQEAYKILVF